MSSMTVQGARLTDRRSRPVRSEIATLLDRYIV
jgi:hypothetical protein